MNIPAGRRAHQHVMADEHIEHGVGLRLDRDLSVIGQQVLRLEDRFPCVAVGDSRVRRSGGEDGETIEVILLKPLRDGVQGFRATGFLFVHGYEAPQHFFLGRRERRASQEARAAR